MTATERLRAMLDERGVEWDELVSHPVVVGTEWHDRDGCPCTALEHADDVPGGMLSVQANLTPEQAIAATLGDSVATGERHGVAGTCEVEGYDDGIDEGMDGDWYSYAPPTWYLSCGHRCEGGERPRYCPVCGKRVVEEDA